jgi:Na+-translocating ferredoxin:NAD+ oxidoreductase RnfC subunit
VGVSLRECVQAAGGATVRDPHYLVGGVMMGRLEADEDALIAKTTGGIVVLPGDHFVTRRYRREWKSMARIGRSACDQCSFCTELCPRYLLGHPIEPHRAMRGLMFTLIGEPNVRGSPYCCECNLCSLWSCPEDLDPKSACSRNKKRLAEMGAKWDSPPFNPDRPGVHLANRKVPIHRLMQKLGLAGFRNEGPMVEKVLEARRVGIALKQHVGAPCEPVVKALQSVKAGEAVGRPPVKDGRPALGAAVHASISGKVTAIEDGIVWIEG